MLGFRVALHLPTRANGSCRQRLPAPARQRGHQGRTPRHGGDLTARHCSLEDTGLSAQGRQHQASHLTPVAHGLSILHRGGHHHRPVRYKGIASDSQPVFKPHLQDRARIPIMNSNSRAQLNCLPSSSASQPRKCPFPQP